MSSQGSAGWPNVPGQSPPGQPPGDAPGATPGYPYGPPQGTPSPYGTPPAYGGPPPVQHPPPYGQPPTPAPPYAAPPPYAPPPPRPGYPPPYGGPPYAPAPVRPRRVWPLVVGIVGGVLALVIIAIVAFAVWYAHLTTSVSEVEFAHGFNTSSKRAVEVSPTFKTTDPEIFCVVRLNVNKDSPTVKFVWTAVDVTNAANQHLTNQQITTQRLDTKNENIIYGSIKRPASAFAAGTYKVDVYLDDTLARTATFTVSA